MKCEKTSEERLMLAIPTTGRNKCFPSSKGNTTRGDFLFSFVAQCIIIIGISNIREKDAIIDHRTKINMYSL
jgi:hypothetical protein